MTSADRPFQVALVCLGNICRSPTAHVVLEQKLADLGLGDRVTVVSSGTADWHEGAPMDRRSAAALSDAGYDPSRHRARTFSTDWFVENDLLLAMDYANRADMAVLAPTVEQQSEVRMFREFDPDATPTDEEVPDPWHGGPEGFIHVLAMIERTCDALADYLARELQNT